MKPPSPGNWLDKAVMEEVGYLQWLLAYWLLVDGCWPLGFYISVCWLLVTVCRLLKED